MWMPHLLYLKEKNTTWFNPCYGLCEFWKEYQKLKDKLNKPHDYIWAHRDLKKAKEIYAISIVAKAVEQQEKGGKWWILKPRIDPPDGVIGTIIKTKGIQKMHLREVEVVEHLEGDILHTIRKKLSTKQYEANTILVCYISKGGIYDFEKESKIISKEITSLNHIFLVFNGSPLSEIPKTATNDELLRAMLKVTLVQIKPVFSVFSIDKIKDCNAWRSGNEPSFFIYEGFGRENSRVVSLDNPPKLFE